METESEERVKLQFDEVCDELNLDQEAKETAWESYIEINNDYVLEVGDEHRTIHVVLNVHVHVQYFVCMCTILLPSLPPSLCQ